MDDEYVNPTNITRVIPSGHEWTHIHFVGDPPDHYLAIRLPIDEVMRKLRGIGEPDTTNYSDV
jgi:hypothetical protein